MEGRRRKLAGGINLGKIHLLFMQRPSINDIVVKEEL
jgi:hypothetical protein